MFHNLILRGIIQFLMIICLRLRTRAFLLEHTCWLHTANLTPNDSKPIWIFLLSVLCRSCLWDWDVCHTIKPTLNRLQTDQSLVFQNNMFIYNKSRVFLINLYVVEQSISSTWLLSDPGAKWVPVMTQGSIRWIYMWAPSKSRLAGMLRREWRMSL